MPLLPRNSRMIALLGVLVALCLAVQLSPRPPNVEFTSLLTFVVGFLFGASVGVSFGSFVMFVNGFVSPWGFAGVSMPFQIVGMGLVGLAGGFYRRFSAEKKGHGRPYEVAIMAAFLTVAYDVITNLSMAITYMTSGMQPSLALMTAFAYGVPLSIVHVTSNILVFALTFFPIVQTLNRTLDVKKPWLKKEL